MVPKKPQRHFPEKFSIGQWSHFCLFVSLNTENVHLIFSNGTEKSQKDEAEASTESRQSLQTPHEGM